MGYHSFHPCSRCTHHSSKVQRLHNKNEVPPAGLRALRVKPKATLCTVLLPLFAVVIIVCRAWNSPGRPHARHACCLCCPAHMLVGLARSSTSHSRIPFVHPMEILKQCACL